MSIRRLLRLVAAFAAVAAAAAVCVVAASFAVYALARTYLGPAGGAAVVTGVFALIALLTAWLATRKVVPKAMRGAPLEETSLIDRVISIAKERPLIAFGAAAAAATVLLRNPAVIGALISAFMAGSATKPKQ